MHRLDLPILGHNRMSLEPLVTKHGRELEEEVPLGAESAGGIGEEADLEVRDTRVSFLIYVSAEGGLVGFGRSCFGRVLDLLTPLLLPGSRDSAQDFMLCLVNDRSCWSALGILRTRTGR